MKLTLEEVSKTYGYSEKSIKTNFRRTAQSFKKKFGLDLIKCNTYEGTYYQVSAPRALTIYEQNKDQIYIPIDSIKMDDLICFILIGVAATPQGVFRGTKKDFLDYIGLAHHKRNLELLSQGLEKFANKQGSPLFYQEDEDYIIIYLKRGFEKQQIITVKMLRACQEIAQKHNKQSMKIIQLLKVLQAYRINEQNGNNLITDKDLQIYTNLSEKQIRDARKLLQGEGIVHTKRIGTPERRIGTQFTINAFVDDQNQVIK